MATEPLQEPSSHAELVKNVREKSSLTQAEMAEKLGISQPMVSYIERGEVEPSQEVIDKLRKMSGTAENPLSEWLRDQRQRMHMTQAELAKKAGISQLTICFIETGKTESPQKATIHAIEKILGKLPVQLQSEIREEAQVGGYGEYLGPFPVTEWESSVREATPGIYVFYDALKRPVRVGETADIRRRLDEYEHNYWWFKPPIVESFAYIIMEDEKLRKQVEATMIKLVGDNAIFNIQHRI